MDTRLLVRAMRESDPEPISAAFTSADWLKPPGLFRRYLAESRDGLRYAVVAEWLGEIAGYVTLLWLSGYPPFAEARIPEIADFNVLPAYRDQGIGTAMLDRVETVAAMRAPVVGLGVGLYVDYGSAQRLYARRGYVPDGRGIMYDHRPVAPGSQIRIDDSATLMLTRRIGALSPQ